MDMEDIDLQFFGENIGFLDNCFDNSFVLQNSLQIVKNHNIEQNESIQKKSSKIYKRKISSHSQNITLQLDPTRNAYTISQTDKNKRKLRDWGLPSEIIKKYEERGITEMFEWQVSCLGNPKVLFEYSNLVYSAPTSAGKTLVAEMLTIKTILERQKKVLIILPFVSIVREKMFYFQDILSSSGIRVEGFMGSQSPPGGLQAVHVAICTIEKANSLVNKLLDEGSIAELGAVIVDELHLLGDPNRGYILELLLTKLKYVSSSQDIQIQIVGMSATLPNLEILANWLNAELFITQFRPIPLDEYCLVGNKYYDKFGNCIANLDSALAVEGDGVLNICLNTIKTGCSVLIFCMTKKWCESLAQSVSASFYKLGCDGKEAGSILRTYLKSEDISEVLEQLKNSPVGLDEVLKKTISFGVAYHHAGLTFDERDIIEGGFKSGAIKVLVATSTLSSGVNLPARKVIVRSPMFQRQPMNILTYKQMIGRAGRMGRDSKGESILLCTETEKKIGFELMMGTLEPVTSCIANEDKYMRAVLEMIASQVLSTKAQLDIYSKCTLLYNQENLSVSQEFLLENTLEELKNYELIRVQSDGEQEFYVATPLGKACLSSSMAPNDGLSLFCELQKARQCLVLETDLHLIYLVTPYSVSSQWANMDWLHLLTLWESLTKAMKRVGELIGVQESFIIRCLRGNNKSNNIQNKVNIHKRFYTALALQELVSEVPLAEVAEKFQCARGFLQSLQQGAATFAGMVTAFCRQLGWKNMEILISQFQDRLHFGIHSELLDLMKLASLNGTRARTLFDSGFETISSIASADANIIENVLHKSVPFQSDRVRDDDDNDDIRKRKKMKSVWITGHRGMTTKEAAENLIAEARRYLSLEIGVAEIKWDNKIKKTSEILESPTSIVANGDSNEKLSPRKKSVYKKIEFKPNVLQDKQTNNSLHKLYFDDSSQKQSSETKELINITKEVLQSSKVIPISKNIKNFAIKNSSPNKNEFTSSLKDEIIWDSLNFTDVALNNETKLRISDKIFSPNISFGEFEKSMTLANCSEVMDSSKAISTKDLSLFSSEGANSSLFEDSLPVDLIPSKLFDKEPTTLCKKETYSDFTNINSNTILNAFKSTLIEVKDSDEDEDIKLAYDEDKIEPKRIELNVIDVDQIKKNAALKRREIADKDLQPLEKKKKTEDQFVVPTNIEISRGIVVKDTISLKSPLSRFFTIEFNNFKKKCYILKANDIIDNFIVFENIKSASIYINLEVSNSNNEIIGSELFNNAGFRTKDAMKEVSPVRGISMHLCDEIVIYLDFTSLEELSAIKYRLCCWLKDKISLKLLYSITVNLCLMRWLGISLSNNFTDVALMEWLIDSTEKVPDMDCLCRKYCGIEFSKSFVKINGKPKSFKSLDRIELMCMRAWCIWMIGEKQEKYILLYMETTRNIIDIENQVSKILSGCEYYGITVDKDLASRLLIDVRNSQETLQRKAYKLCGYHFNFNSPKDVAKALGMYNGRRMSTRKSVLTSYNTPLSSIIIYWRKLNSILTKTLYPLTEKACIYSEGNRINPSYTMFTCTGRISMHEPNLQNVPRTFSIPSEYLTVNSIKCDDVEFNCRNIFKATAGYVIISADYCQLEMRILTHFSQDQVLLRIMKSDVDVFKSIAASWGNVSEDEVDDDLRQKSKQLCYGIIYGMGNKTLSTHLDVTELEAAVFMDTFYKSYPAVRLFTQSVKDECRQRGYVETLSKRRRYLPDINSKVAAKKSAAERQAVNTMIQGSAADIAKAAMCSIDDKIESMVPKPHLILHMHDELVYEVPECFQQSFISIMKKVMEETVKLTVPLPVKVKSGHSWGDLREIKL